ncbi:hypothetical protein C8J56DRAFT_354537 [Mycena floridula]|nr:hypothetical protein C8J56DRAFT_354537 [Mycena floridula]
MQPEMAVELATLSRGLKPFIGLLYRSISLGSQPQLVSFVQLVRSGSRPLSFYHDRIRNICVLPAVRFEHALTILSVCRDATIVAFRSLIAQLSLEEPNGAFLPYFSTLRPTRLALLVDRWDIKPGPGLDWLQQLTHLQISITFISRRSSPSQEFRQVLQHLPGLTHLCYIDRFYQSSFTSSLCLSSKFVVCIIWVSNSPGPSWINGNEYDPRVILLFFGKGTWDTVREEAPDYVLVRDLSLRSNFLHDWGRKTSSQLDMWELAEEKVELQRRLRNSS